MDEHYYTENPQSEIKEKTFSHTIKNTTLQFVSVSGVFAFGDKVDKASGILIQSFSPSGSTILDMGCGYGAMGLFIKALFKDQNVNMVDVNNRAVHYSKMNADKNKLHVNVFQSNLYSNLDGMLFDDILSNPPIAAGKKLNTELINEAYHHLNDNGALWLVAFHNKGGSTLKGIMESRFGNAEDVYKGGGIRVYKSVKKS